MQVLNQDLSFYGAFGRKGKEKFKAYQESRLLRLEIVTFLSLEIECKYSKQMGSTF